ncbi:hypothetical protein NIES21_15260 [Anabaenopsis circularis NIES-21]|uniref:Uncharacterized protein n=1 Tax=Anabaenopsis circularis NIES-21 TaxID=1085406 RepID=A0A1Z4GDZ9_9CYAN|nr:hypothetical protein NIES21_15260 [Anabaenopsis circularis NIES-21]
MACNTGEKPIIRYSFNGGGERIYKTELSPVDIEILNGADSFEGNTENFSSEGFQLTFYSPNNFKYFDVVVLDYRIKDIGYLDLEVVSCGETTWSDTMITIDPNTISINPNIRCPIVTDQCMIKIKHNGNTIFRDKGKQPCNYTVQCGRCPEGQCECSTPNYPGYCCVDCAELAGEIKGIRNLVRSLKNGR